MRLIGHVLTGSPIPLAVQWVVAALLFGGVVAALAFRSKLWRLVAKALAVCGFVGTVGTMVIAALQPGAAPYAIRISGPPVGARVSRAVTFTVCGVRADGSTLPAADAAHYLIVFIDGHEVATFDTSRFVRVLDPGTYDIRVDLVTPAHHAFNPPASATTRVTVTDHASTESPIAC